MKIVITVSTYYPKKDGVQYVTQYQAETLSKMGHDVTVITSRLAGSEDFEIVNNVKVIRVDAQNKYTLHFGNKKKFLNTVFEQIFDADVMINVCLQSYSADWLLNDLDKINIKKVLIVHGIHDFKIIPKNWFDIKNNCINLIRNIRWGLFYLTNFKKISKYNLITHLHEEDDSFKLFTRKVKTRNVVIYNAVEDDFFKDYETQTKQDYFVNVANYSPRKDQLSLIKSIYKINEDIKIYLIGSRKNNYYKKLEKVNEKLSKKCGINKVSFLIGLDRNDIKRYISNSNGFVLSSKWEAFPISIIEAMALKKPFISSNVGIVKYLPGGITLHNFKDLNKWLKLFYYNEILSKKYGDIGHLYAKTHFTQSNQVKILIKYIEEIGIL